MNDLDKLKQEYNHNLTRFNNGCKYCEEHKDEIDKWLPELFKIHGNMGRLLDEIEKYEKVESKQIREGFEL